MIEVRVDRQSLKSLFNALDVPETTGYRYLKFLDSLLTGQTFWTYQKGDGSVDSDGIKIITIYYQLTRDHKIQFCKKQLLKELTKHGYNIQQNQQSRQRQNRTNSTQSRDYERQQSTQSTAKSSDYYDSLFGI